MKRLLTALSWTLCVLAPCATATRVEAHALPMGMAISWPQSGSSLPWVLTNRGVVFGEQQGGTLRCNEAFFVNTSATPSFWAADGLFVLGTPSQVLSSSDQGCSLSVASGLPDLLFGGFTVLDDAEQTILLPMAQHDDARGGVYASVDHGKTFVQRSTNEAQEAFTQLVSSAGRVYATGFRLDPAVGKVVGYVWAVSDDGARSFTRTPLPRERVVLGISPVNPAVVFAYETLDRTTGAVAIMQSSDGGATFVERLHLLGRPSFAADPGGTTFWLGAAGSEGLWVSHDGGASFASTRPELTAITCLGYHQGALHACARRFPIVLGVWSASSDEAPLKEELLFADVNEPVACGGAADICASSWNDWSLELLSGAFDGDAGISVDAGTAAGPLPPSDAATPAAPELDATSASVPPSAADASSLPSRSADSGCQIQQVPRSALASRAFLSMLAMSCALWLRRRRAQRGAPA